MTLQWMTCQSRIWEHLQCCYHVDLRCCWSQWEQLRKISHRTLTQENDAEHRTCFELWALKQKAFQYSWHKYVKCPFSRLSTNVELQLVTPPLCAGTTVRFARRQSNRHLPPWTTNQNRLGELFTIFWWWQTQMFIKLEKTFSHSSICQWY